MTDPTARPAFTPPTALHGAPALRQQRPGVTGAGEWVPTVRYHQLLLRAVCNAVGRPPAAHAHGPPCPDE